MTEDESEIAEPSGRGFSRRGILLAALVSEIGLLALAAALGYGFGIPFWEDVHFTGVAVALGVGVALVMAAIALGIAARPFGPLRQIREDFERVLTLFENSTTLDLIVISMLAGVGEEAFFRGALQPLIAGGTGEAAAIGIVALLFGLAHAISPMYFFFAAGISVLFSLLYTATGNLAVPIVAHAVYDAVALVVGARIWIAPKTVV